jgi:uncharacterized protein
MKWLLSKLRSFKKEYEVIIKEKEAIIKSIQEQNALSSDLEKKIQQVLIYRSLKISISIKRKNKSRRCCEHGLEPLAKIMAQNNDDVDFIATIIFEQCH